MSGRQGLTFFLALRPAATATLPSSVMNSGRFNWHSMPANQAGLQDIELATISQRVSERFHNHPTVEEPVRCPGWVLAVRKLQRPPRT
jgi:hypothetical protein